MLVQKMRKAAQEMGYECTIDAHAFAEAAEYVPEADIILLGPQIKFKESMLKENYPDKIVACIDMKMYGKMDGAEVVKMAKEKMGD
jgi:Phosphotransferase system cellobiose-specific component IIB